MKLKDLAPLPHERGVIIGCTGSGKSTLGEHLLQLYRFVIVIDPKQTFGSGERGGGHLPGYQLARTPAELESLARRHPRVQYRPDMDLQTPEEWERIYDWIYRRGKTMIYTDELFDIHHHNRPPRAFRRCITSGRELGIGMLHATQRPRGIDRRILSEAERHYVFHLRDPDDVRFLRARVGESQLPDYGFYYTRDKSPFEPPRILRLKL